MWFLKGAHLTIGAMLLTSVLQTAAPAAADTRFYVRVGPPAPLVETRVGRPGRGYVWVPGYYRWDRRDYVWVPGRWTQPPRGRARWDPGHWRRDRQGWYYVEGRWR